MLLGRKDPLAHLHSNLSPKYIGFTTPPNQLDTSNNGKEERTRSLRRRHNNSALNADTSVEKDKEIDVSFTPTSDSPVGFVRRTPRNKDSPGTTPDRNTKRKDFVSPIDKLLIKNGAVMENNNLPLEDKNEAAVNDKEALQKNVKTKNNKNSMKTKEDDVMEDLGVKNLENDDEKIHQEDKEEKVDFENGLEKTDQEEKDNKSVANGDCKDDIKEVEEEIESNISISCEMARQMEEFEDETKSLKEAIQSDIEEDIEKIEKTETQSNNDVEDEDKDKAVANTTKEKQNNQETETENEENLKPETNKEIPNLQETKDQDKMEITITDSPETKSLLNEEQKENNEVKIEMESAETESSNEFVVDASTSANSPSAVSMDSAKGSSIVTEGSWMSFSTGDLFWGQIYNYCYWPCMVCPDPEGKTITTEEVGRSGDQIVLVHVRFFADNGRRNWVKRENLLPYNGIENYQERIDEVREKYGAKSAKYKLYVPAKRKEQVWFEAVNEANIVAEVAYADRLEKFYEIFEKSK